MMRPLLAACIALAAASAAHAQQPQPATGTPDLDNGRMLTYTCHGCHGIPNYKNAYPNYRVPKIGGQPEPYLVNALTEYRNSGRRHPTMEVQAKSFSDQDIADIAAFLSSLQQ